MHNNWEICIDTGGTFTDCWAQEPKQLEPRLVKVLSSGRLRMRCTALISEHVLQLEIPASWRCPDDFFVGFKIIVDGRKTQAVSWNQSRAELQLDNDFQLAEMPNSIELHTGEEAPVIGMRLLTGTGISEKFPPLNLRLATTRGTNALLELKGAEICFFTTKGFADLLEIRDQRRADLFALQHAERQSLYQNVIEVDARMDAEGSELEPLAPNSSWLAEAKSALASGCKVAAVALLHSYQNPAHEEQVREQLLELGFDHVSLSSELAPMIKILPRAETAVIDAYLTPIMQSFIRHVHSAIGDEQQMLTMTSAGGLESPHHFRPKDSLFSGPAGGVVGAAAAARQLGHEKIITFDMGGTSTDVARYDGDYQYQFEQRIGDASLMSAALKIATVAAGGGSICQWTDAGLRVGPESAGANPGPACYGRGGPLTITDVNLLLGRIDPDNFGIPIGKENISAAREKLHQLQKLAGDSSSEQNFLEGLAAIATEQMADAIRNISIREGAAPEDYALMAFGGAGPMHACDIAELLGMQRILVPAEAGLLSAYGLHHAVIERFAEKQMLIQLDEQSSQSIQAEIDQLCDSALDQLNDDLGENHTQPLEIRRRLAELRMLGQDATLTVEFDSLTEVAPRYRQLYEKIFGYPADADRQLELVSLRIIASTEAKRSSNTALYQADSVAAPTQRFINRASVNVGDSLAGPVIIQDPFSTLYLKAGWTATKQANGALTLEYSQPAAQTNKTAESADSAVQRELFRHRFGNIVEEMGAMLQRSSISTNVKERLDFSCALLDANGELVVNAPHIPVHLGALGLCVREVAKQIAMQPGDTIITNHPAFGGSHLPDVTLITPVFAQNDPSQLVAYLANRAHHAEIGGISSGSMPPDAKNLAEEGVVIPPSYLYRGGQACFDQLEKLLTESPYPTRKLADNIADLNAQAAANLRGKLVLEQMLKDYGIDHVSARLEELAAESRDSLSQLIRHAGFETRTVSEKLDNGTVIQLTARIDNGKLQLDFTGTSASYDGNLNATPAIIRSAVLYVMRLWTQSNLPLNEGLLRDVEIKLPTCFLNPEFPAEAENCPAVVGGNVETSQRVVDTLIKLLELQACSQGTMNNFIFGDETFGYYETICGGCGAGDGYHGASARHSHMTNTAITDAEIFEKRYPLSLLEFSIRKDSGGAGAFRGGDGIVREVEFLKPLSVSLLTQHRSEKPYGLAGGEAGSCGRQILTRKGSQPETLAGIVQLSVSPGDRLRIETPGGGAYGESQKPS
ncbi:hydantoinase B/oxoprolinase family protein [Persicirhabdus sediminis]|uniref:Hydantoinase B/oxoprolinase family protein n=1 Tax=Persicirhabdus sediminis TaxID=454144 RepID=A0A8J7M9W3_9BACT|nr:hydantoinase B/oxoprolinase family protein [Persicirhabdus sediminis]MBK1789572.1 hydantoinase B/oxoprolinase family protein [Persicirhabdus sediminis]